MADNTILNANVTVGDTYAADDIGGVKYQRVKLVIGADGSNDGDVYSANPLPVNIRAHVTPKRAVLSFAASGDNTLVAAVAAKKIRVLAMAIFARGTVDIYFTDGAAGTGVFADSTNPVPLDKTGALGAGGFVLNHNPDGWFETTANTALVANLSGAIGCGGGMVYIEA